MLRLASLADKGPLEVRPEDSQQTNLCDIWLEVVDPTKKEIEKVAEDCEPLRDFLLCPDPSNVVNLRLEPELEVINSSIRALTLATLYLTIIISITSFPNTMATFFGTYHFGNSTIAIALVALLLSILLPCLWFLKRKWVRTTFEALETHGP